MGDWADERAAEWLDQAIPALNDGDLDASLAALLREVRHDSEAEVQHDGVMQGYCKRCTDHVLAEVRRVVKQSAHEWHEDKDTCWSECCREILSRLDKLA